MHASAVDAVDFLLQSGEALYIVPQNIYEFWNVCTRPADRNGLGWTVSETEEEVNRLERQFPLLSDSPAVYAEWRRLVLAHAVIGVSVHDARLAAAMRIHGLTHILTFNDRDFARYGGIAAINPADVRPLPGLIP